MSSIFSDEHKNAIDIHEFIDADWSVSDFLEYRELCSKIRAAIITPESGEADVGKMLGAAVSDLTELVNRHGTNIQPLGQQFVDALAAQIRYLDNSDYSGAGVLPTFYRSEEDFRALIENEIYKLLHPGLATNANALPFCDTKEKALSVQEAYLNERRNVFEHMDLDLPDEADEYHLSAWAKKKANDIYQIEKIDSLLDLLQRRIDELSGDGVFDAHDGCLYVYKGFIKCLRDHHAVTCVNALIPNAYGKTVSLNVNYCTDCKRFFISYEEYCHYLKIHGTLLVKIILLQNDDYSDYDGNLAAASPLKLCGYSVSMEKGLTTTARQNLLTTVIHNGIMKKSEVIRYLNWFITMQGSKFGNEIAKLKWEEDLRFVRNLDCDKQTDHVINNISIYGKFGRFSKGDGLDDL